MGLQISRGGRTPIAFLGWSVALVLIALSSLSKTAQGEALVLNEFNAVAADSYLDAGSYRGATKEDTFFQAYLGLPDGRIEGNGGNWVELLVVQDHVDIRGWRLKWAEEGAGDTTGHDIWFGNAGVEQGIITFSDTAAIWSDLRAGTIVTISEKQSIPVDTDWDGEGDDRNFTDGLNPGDPEVNMVVDLSTDVESYDPLGGNFNIHVSSRQEQADGTFLVHTVTNVLDDNPGDFSVGPAGWQLSIFDDTDTLHFGPIGEDIAGWGGGGVNDEELGKLQAPEAEDNWDLNDWASQVDVSLYRDGTTSTFRSANIWGGGTQMQDLSALQGQIPEPATLLLLASGGAALLLMRLRRKRAR